MKIHLKITLLNVMFFILSLIIFFLFKDMAQNLSINFRAILFIFFCILSFALLVFLNKFILLEQYSLIEKLNDTIKNINYNLTTSISDNFLEMEKCFLEIFTSIKTDIFNILIKEGELKREKEKAEELSSELVSLNKNLEIKVSERTNELLIEKEKAEYANKMKDEFLAKVSHEMRTPLTPIIGYSRILKDLDNLTADTANKLEIIHNSGVKLLNFTNELLDFSKIISGKVDLNYENFDLASLFNDIYHEYKDLADEKKLNFKIDIDKSITIYSDRMKIYEISKNIIHNAIKYTNKGFVYVEVELKDLSLKINVHDSGVGIAEENLDYIFQSFAQISKHSNGIGLGLSIVHKLLDTLGGTIEVNSKIGIGTTFKVSIPINIQDRENENFSNVISVLLNCNNYQMKSIILKSILRLPLRVKDLKENYKKQDVEAMRKTNHIILGTYGNMNFDIIYKISKNISNLLKEENIDNSAILYEIEELEKLTHTLKFHSLFEDYLNLLGRKLRILIAEDVEENREFFKILLEICPSLEIITVENGLEAIIFLENDNNFDFIFLDIQMPVMDGIETLKKIKQNENLKSIPTIALTAQAILGDKEKYLPYGFDFYITKPINESVLFSCLESFL